MNGVSFFGNLLSYAKQILILGHFNPFILLTGIFSKTALVNLEIGVGFLITMVFENFLE